MWIIVSPTRRFPHLETRWAAPSVPLYAFSPNPVILSAAKDLAASVETGPWQVWQVCGTGILPVFVADPGANRYNGGSRRRIDEGDDRGSRR